eukprot:3965860-Heterocapsa_arctica.AAC.1
MSKVRDCEKDLWRDDDRGEDQKLVYAVKEKYVYSCVRLDHDYFGNGRGMLRSEEGFCVGVGIRWKAEEEVRGTSSWSTRGTGADGTRRCPGEKLEWQSRVAPRERKDSGTTSST